MRMFNVKAASQINCDLYDILWLQNVAKHRVIWPRSSSFFLCRFDFLSRSIKAFTLPSCNLEFYTSPQSHIPWRAQSNLAIGSLCSPTSLFPDPCWTLTPFSQDTTVTSLVRSKGAGKPATETPAVTAEEGTNSGPRGCNWDTGDRNCSLYGTGLLQKCIWSQVSFWCDSKLPTGNWRRDCFSVALTFRCHFNVSLQLGAEIKKTKITVQSSHPAVCRDWGATPTSVAVEVYLERMPDSQDRDMCGKKKKKE